MNLSMNRFIVAACVLFLSIATPVFARDLAVVMSSQQTPHQAQQEAKHALKFLTKMEPGDRAVFVLAEGPAILGEFVIPAQKAYASPKARLAYNGQTVKALLDMAKAAQAPATGFSKAISLPDVLPFVSNNLAKGKPWDVLILGSPLYHNTIEQSFSMLNGHIPSDGHFSADSGNTPFSVKGRENRLSGLRVHIAYAGEQFNGPRHLHYVQRFWTLYAEQQSAQVISFVGDLTTALNNIQQNSSAPSHNYQLVPSDKMEMIQLRPVQLESAQSIYERPITPGKASLQDAIRADKVEVAISWSCQHCDLDLYAKPFPGAQTLSYAHTETSQGRYWKDYRDQSEASKGYETISFNVPLDLRALALGVNFYSGRKMDGVTGEIRLSLNGQTYAKPFEINAWYGSNKANMDKILDSRRSSVVQAIYIDALDIIGLKR